MGEWKTIDSAPRDGTPILGFSAEYGQRETRMAQYREGSPGFDLWARGDGPLNVGWEWSEPKANCVHSWKPTHWMPRPENPA